VGRRAHRAPADVVDGHLLIPAHSTAGSRSVAAVSKRCSHRLAHPDLGRGSASCGSHTADRLTPATPAAPDTGVSADSVTHRSGNPARLPRTKAHNGIHDHARSRSVHRGLCLGSAEQLQARQSHRLDPTGPVLSVAVENPISARSGSGTSQCGSGRRRSCTPAGARR
jgi:hypothetical protein